MAITIPFDYYYPGRNGKFKNKIFVVCPKCGNEYKGQWFCTQETIDNSPPIDSLGKCSFCGTNIKMDEINTMIIKGNTTANHSDLSCFKQVHSKIYQAHELAVSKKIYSFLEKQRNKSIKSQSITIPEENKIDFLKRYLKAVINIETAIQTATKQLIFLTVLYEKNKVRKEIYDNEQAKKLEEKIQKIDDESSKISLHVENEIAKEFSNRIAEANLVKPQIDTINISILKPEKPEPFTMEKPQPPIMPTLEKPNLFNKKKVTLANEKQMTLYNEAYKFYLDSLNIYNDKHNKYQHQLEQYNLQLQAYEDEKRSKYEYLLNEYNTKHKIITEEFEKEVENRKKELEEKHIAHLVAKKEKAIVDSHRKAAETEAAKKDTFLNLEIDYAKKQLKQLQSGLSKLYSYNIIYQKYHNLVAVSSFYEYLDSERCDALEGTNGVYNLYESEIRANAIITQLNVISESLETIKNNQFLLYQQLNNLNKTLTNISKGLNKCLDELKNINKSCTEISEYAQIIKDNTSVMVKNTAITAHFSEMTAYYSKKNSELLDALGFLMALK